jgi:hypothetical protein
LFDAYHVPKLLSQQLLSFGRSGDLLEELTFGVELFLFLFVRCRQSACVWRTVREVRVQPSYSRVRRVLARFHFPSDFVLGFRCSWFADGPSFSSGRSGSRADGLPGLRGRSDFLGLCLVVLLAFTNYLRHLAGRSAWPLRTVHGSWLDCPRGQCGQSAPPGRTIRPSWPDSLPVPGSFVPWFDSSLLSFVLPRVLQGIVPKT